MNIQVFQVGQGQKKSPLASERRSAFPKKTSTTGKADQITFSGKNNATYNAAAKRGLKNIGWEGPIGVILGQAGLALFHMGSWITVPVGILGIMAFQFMAGIMKKAKP